MDGCCARDVRFFVWLRLNMPDPLTAIRGHLRGLAGRHDLGKARLGYEGSFECVPLAHNAGGVMANTPNAVAWLRRAPGAGGRAHDPFLERYSCMIASSLSERHLLREDW